MKVTAGGILVLALIAAALIFAVCGRCDPTPSLHLPDAFGWPTLLTGGVDSLTQDKPPWKPDKPPAGDDITAAGHGVATVTDSTGAVDTLEVYVVEQGDEVTPMASWNGQPVEWVEWSYRKDTPRIRGYIEAASVSGEIDYGAGASYDLWTPGDWAVGPAVSVDLPDAGWGAVSGRVSRELWRSVDVGAEIGHRWGEDSGLHVGVSAGIRF
jgi:hypothetical protein